MKRIQIQIDDGLWQALYLKSRETEASISELVRRALRDRYLPAPAARREAMLAIVGIRKDLPVTDDSTTYIRRLRSGTRRRQWLDGL